MEREGGKWSGLTADDDVCAPACDCVHHRAVRIRSVLVLLLLDWDWDVMIYAYPKALASLGINSVPIQAIVATPVE
jgi:hypothetical protein